MLPAVDELERLKAEVARLRGAEEALRRSEARLAACVQNTPGVAIQWYSPDGRVLFWNRASEVVFGFSAEEALGRSLAELIHTPEEAAEFRQLLARVREGGPFGPAEFPFRRRDGTRGSCISTVFEIATEAGDPCFVCMDVDITERLRAEDALRESEGRYRRLLEVLPDAVWLERSGRIEWVNSACLRLLGAAEASELVGLAPDDLLAAPELRLLRRASPGERVELRLRRLDGLPVEVELVVGALDGATQVALRDVTARKQLDEARRHSQKMEAVGRLAGGVAHDFNNLLTVILSTCDVLLRGGADVAAQRSLLHEVRHAGERAAALTRQLLAFTRKGMVAPRVIEPNQIVRDLAGMLRRLIGEDVRLSLELDPDAGLVKADPAQLEQVVLNLALNARDAMPQGGSLVIATRPEGQWVELEVLDTGVGMDEATRSRLFEPFFTTKEAGKGTGLGLATVYAIVEQCGGKILVDTAPGRGTSMTVRLPRTNETPLLPGTRADPGLPRGHETILVVEDDPMVRRVVARTLAELGYRVLEAIDGEEALGVAGAHEGEIHLLLTDVIMPRMSGRELVATLLPRRPALRILYCSGYTDDTVLRHGIQTEGLMFLQKPFTTEGLARKVREVLDRPST